MRIAMVALSFLAFGSIFADSMDTSGGLEAIVGVSEGQQDGGIRAKIGLKNLSGKSVVFMYCGWTNCMLEVRDATGKEVARTKSGKMWSSVFDPLSASRRRVNYFKIGGGKTIWTFQDIRLESFFKFQHSGTYKVRVIFEDRFPGAKSGGSEVWTGKVKSRWVSFNIAK